MGRVLLMRSRVLAAVCCVVVALAAMVASGGWRASGVSAQAPVDYDTDDDGLIKINYWEQPDAARLGRDECENDDDCVVSE